MIKKPEIILWIATQTQQVGIIRRCAIRVIAEHTSQHSPRIFGFTNFNSVREAVMDCTNEYTCVWIGITQCRPNSKLFLMTIPVDDSDADAAAV